MRSWMNTYNWRGPCSWVIGLAMVAMLVFYGGQAILADGRTGPVTLVVYAFSTQEEALTQRIFPEFEQAWEARTGRELVIEGIFGPSGVLAGQINLGAPADVALLSNSRHVNWLKVGRQVSARTEPVAVCQTPLVIVTRPGNPANIATFGDLAQPGLRLIHADPRSSGAGEWAILAEYGSAFLTAGDRVAARQQVTDIWQNVRLLAPSARAMLTLFELGAGDAFVTYEQDARLAVDRGIPLEIVVPSETIMAQHMAVLVDANLTIVERPVAREFVDFLAGEAGQDCYGRYHLRPVTPGRDIAAPFTVDDLGGWSQAYAELVEDLWQADIEPRLNLEPAYQLLNSGDD